MLYITIDESCEIQVYSHFNDEWSLWVEEGIFTVLRVDNGIVEELGLDDVWVELKCL